ncbi:hypothetical protein ACP70R_029227 [Stipagrostis hirtigluma subsp. patula]
MAETATARWTPRRRTNVPSLPEELVVWEILVRLPAKDVLRCRAVCHSWRRLASDADFALAHHERQPSLPLVFFHGRVHRYSPSVVVDAALDALHLGAAGEPERRPVLRFNDYNQGRGFNVHTSCDGLLLLSLPGSRVYVCNPATRQWMAPPNLTGGNVVGLYPHTPSGEYRVLYWKWSSPPQGYNAVYYVLSLGSPAEPTYIGLPVTSPSVKQIALRHVDGHPPVLLHSCLHWALRLLHEKTLLVFHTVAESFRLMSSPIPPDSQRTLAQLLEMDGLLGISHVDEGETTVKLWVLQDYETEVWSFMYHIEIPMLEIRNIADHSSFAVTVVSQNGDVLVRCSSSCHLFHCDRKGRLLKMLRWDCVCSRPTGHWFKESLVRHAFFQGQDGDLVGQPRLFQGF